MDYLDIVCKGYIEKYQHGTPLDSFFKREAQKAKRDEFCEFNDFFNGCKKAVESLKANIQQQLNNEIHENKSAINILQQGRMKHEDGHLIIDKEEIEEHVKIFEEQMNCLDINDFQIYFKNAFENKIPRFYYSELIEIENIIQIAESEINNLFSSQNSKIMNGINVNQSGAGKIIVSTGDKSKQAISELSDKKPDKKDYVVILSIMIPLLGILFYVIAEWDNVLKFFK